MWLDRYVSRICYGVGVYYIYSNFSENKLFDYNHGDEFEMFNNFLKESNILKL